VSHWCHGIGVLGDRVREVSKSAGVWVGQGWPWTWRCQSYLCCGSERALVTMEGSGEKVSMSPAAKESRRCGSKMGVSAGRCSFLNMHLLI
jgi:hypothetical protein